MKEILLTCILVGGIALMASAGVDQDTFLLVTYAGGAAVLWYVFRSDKKKGA